MSQRVSMPYDDNVWYHVTDRSRLPDIAQRGLLGSRRGTDRTWGDMPVEEQAVYLWPNVNQAWAYSQPPERDNLWGGPEEHHWNDPVILRVSDINRNELAPDHETYSNWIDDYHNAERDYIDPRLAEEVSPEFLDWMSADHAAHPHPGYHDPFNHEQLQYRIEQLRRMPPEFRTYLASKLARQSGDAVMHYGHIPPHHIEVGHPNVYDERGMEQAEEEFDQEHPEWTWEHEPEDDNEREEWIEAREQALDDWMGEQGNWTSPDDAEQWREWGYEDPEDDSNTHSFRWKPLRKQASDDWEDPVWDSIGGDPDWNLDEVYKKRRPFVVDFTNPDNPNPSVWIGKPGEFHPRLEPYQYAGEIWEHVSPPIICPAGPPNPVYDDDAKAQVERAYHQMNGTNERTAMAERTGNPKVDALIEEFLQTPMGDWINDERPNEALRDPEMSHGACDAVTEDFVNFAKARGFKAYVTHTDLDEMGYKPTGEGGEIGFNENDEMQYGFYPEHTIATIVVDDPRYPYGKEYYIDFTATQYGYTDHPKVTSKTASDWDFTPEPLDDEAQHFKWAIGPWGVDLWQTDGPDGKPWHRDEGYRYHGGDIAVGAMWHNPGMDPYVEHYYYDPENSPGHERQILDAYNSGNYRRPNLKTASDGDDWMVSQNDAWFGPQNDSLFNVNVPGEAPGMPHNMEVGQIVCARCGTPMKRGDYCPVCGYEKTAERLDDDAFNKKFDEWDQAFRPPVGRPPEADMNRGRYPYYINQGQVLIGPEGGSHEMINWHHGTKWQGTGNPIGEIWHTNGQPVVHAFEALADSSPEIEQQVLEAYNRGERMPGTWEDWMHLRQAAQDKYVNDEGFWPGSFDTQATDPWWQARRPYAVHPLGEVWIGEPGGHHEGMPTEWAKDWHSIQRGEITPDGEIRAYYPQWEPSKILVEQALRKQATMKTEDLLDHRMINEHLRQQQESEEIRLEAERERRRQDALWPEMGIKEASDDWDEILLNPEPRQLERFQPAPIRYDEGWAKDIPAVDSTLDRRAWLISPEGKLWIGAPGEHHWYHSPIGGGGVLGTMYNDDPNTLDSFGGDLQDANRGRLLNAWDTMKQMGRDRICLDENDQPVFKNYEPPVGHGNLPPDHPISQHVEKRMSGEPTLPMSQHLAADNAPGMPVSDSGHWVWLDGKVGMGGVHSDIAHQLATELGYDKADIAYISNWIARGHCPPDKAVAVGTLKNNYPYILNSTRDRNHVWDAVKRHVDSLV